MKATILSACALSAVTVLLAREAHADPATVEIQGPPRHDGFAPPPPPRTIYVGGPPILVRDETPPPPPPLPRPEAYRSPLRLSLGPMGVTSGRGVGMGMGVAADFGRDAVGFRLAASWLRGEPQGSALDPSPLGAGLAQYTGELTVDFDKAGPVHPLLGLGFGLAKVSRGQDTGNLGVGIGRLGLEYALCFDDDVDFRLGLALTGALPGPSDHEVSDVRGYALMGAYLGMGF